MRERRARRRWSRDNAIRAFRYPTHDHVFGCSSSADALGAAVAGTAGHEQSVVKPMIDVRAFLVDLNSRGIKLALDGDNLRTRAAPGAIDADLAARLRGHKQEIVAFLRQRAEGERGGERDIPRAARGGLLRPSFAQQRLWFLDRLAGSSSYIIPIALSVRGRLDRSAFQHALDTILGRHESLRTVFREVDGEIYQHVLPEGALPVQEYDLTGLPPHRIEAELHSLGRLNAQQPFNLTCDFMIRVCLIRTGEDAWGVLAAMHHIASDGWSINVFLREFSALYEAARAGRTAQLEPLTIQYADYAEWQRGSMQESRFESRLDYWRRQLQSVPQVHSIALDHARPSIKGAAAFRVARRIDPAMVAALKELGRRHDATLFMVLYSALTVVLSCWSRSEDVVIGVPISGRTHRQLQPLIGFFANTLVLRAAVNRTLSFSSLLRQNRARCLDAYEHQDVPFERLVEILQPERTASYTPLVQILFSVPTVDHRMLACAELDIEVQSPPWVGSSFDLEITAVEDATGFELRWDADRNLFERSTIDAMSNAHALVLEQVLADADVCIGRLDLVSQRDRELLHRWNATASPAISQQCLHALIEHQAAASPERIAVICGDTQLSYEELNRRGDELACRLRRRHMQPEARVGLYIGRSVEMMVALLGILKAGCAYVPIDADAPLERLNWLLTSGALNAIVTVAALVDTLHAATVPVVVLEEGEDIPVPERNALRAIEITPRHLAYVIYTSGSTGRPKGVMVEHGSVLNLWGALQSAVLGSSRQPRRVALNAALSFDASVQAIVQLLSGHTIVIVPGHIRADGPAFAAFLRDARIEVLDCTPAQLDLLPLHQDAAELECVLIGGDAIGTSVWRELARSSGTQFYNVYGPTECTVDTTFARIDGDTGEPRIGRPLANARVYVLDETLQQLPIGVAGEIYIGGPGVARGYLNQPGLTAERFVPDPFVSAPGARMYRTGDVGRWMADGSIAYIGRNDHQIKLRGFRIELAEIEARLCACENVQEAAVIVREVAPGDQRLVAYLRARAGAELCAADLHKQLAADLPQYMLPSAFVTLARLPLSSNGKLIRTALPEPDADAFVAAPYEPPNGATEQWLAEVWRSLLKVERVGRDDNFFELGGHSLLATQLVARIRTTLNIELPLQVLFDGPKLKDLGAWCAGREGARGFLDATERT